ncbi:MAG: family 10 glycosylhydrolase [Provencibacterium sp.]|jgi:uncharacterized lipoprotein YddW (UPF0748 family)|nr:family 10 glycosylhydrolase [Provencibacterium sp.]
MRKIFPFLAAALLLLPACSAKPEEAPHDTISGTIWLQTPETSSTEYPEENPPASEEPPLDAPIEVSGSEIPEEIPAPEDEGTVSSGTEDVPKGEELPVSGKISEEVRAVWISYLEMQELLTGRNEAEFRVNIAEAFDHIEALGLNTVFAQVRPFGDALYSSDYFPWSYIVTGSEGQDPGFDPLQVMIEEARNRGLRIDAWVNPYRVRAVEAEKPLSAENIAVQWADNGTGDAIRYNGGLYLNPGSENARQLIVNGVREILEKYEVDGIQFDDYFYPTQAMDFDQQSYESYRAAGGELSQDAWRRENVNILIREVYQTVKSVNEDLLFGVSPQGNNDNNYHNQFIDVAKWLANEGYVDYICPQIYFGFQNEIAPFKSTVESWNRMIKVDSIRLYVGLAPYKIGRSDEWAGAGREEWLEETDLLARMVAFSREQSHYGGFALYRYASLFMPDSEVAAAVEQELEALKESLK